MQGQMVENFDSIQMKMLLNLHCVQTNLKGILHIGQALQPAFPLTQPTSKHCPKAPSNLPK
eukprot:10613394-Ditylum_brightwellii.AAC.1